MSPEEMGRADESAIAAGAPAELLMRRAGDAVARAAIEVAGGRYGRRAVVVCGKGSNGGDGFVAARRLAREGLAVTCLTVTDASASSGAARRHLERLRGTGVPVLAFESRHLARADVIVDAIFGTGFEGAARGRAAAAIEAMNDAPAGIVAVDIPSGVDGLTGGAAGAAVRAAMTVVMAAQKYGTAVSQGSVLAGRVRVADIGITVPDTAVALTEPADVRRAIPARKPESHKRSGGAVALLAGATGMSGAALLAARGAVRMGAGYATLGTTSSVDAAKAIALPEVLSQVVSDGDALGPASLTRFDDVLRRADALALGPGLGRGDDQRNLVINALDDVDIPIALDADGLNALVKHTKPLERRTGATVITPHPGELARLLNSDIADIQADRLGAAQRAAARLRCVVVLKGWRTVVANARGRTVVNPTGGAELATAGTGDVLTGAVAALLAAGLDPFDAAWAAVFVHGEAGAIAARSARGGVLAWDVAEALPHALSALPGERPQPADSGP
ncbi:bifunctional ADP-dependent NAD(P)H-hydrate dehydratase/NAD(P)H-hydrate epimerase [soil metagenome]